MCTILKEKTTTTKQNKTQNFSAIISELQGNKCYLNRCAKTRVSFLVNAASHSIFTFIFWDEVLLIPVKPKPSCIINENSDYNPVSAHREREEHRLALTDACLWHGKQCLLSGHTKPSMNWKTHALQRQRKQYRSIIGYHVHRPGGKRCRMRGKVSTLIYCKTL